MKLNMKKCHNTKQGCVIAVVLCLHFNLQCFAHLGSLSDAGIRAHVAGLVAYFKEMLSQPMFEGFKRELCPANHHITLPHFHIYSLLNCSPSQHFC